MALSAIPFSKVKNKHEITALYRSAFPKKEQFPWATIRFLIAIKQADLTAYYDGDIFCGFTYTMDYKGALFVLYLAVNGQIRSRGYGSKILGQLKKEHLGKHIFLNIEPPIEHASNYTERLKRLTFYQRNGFFDTGYEITEVGGTFRVLSTEENADIPTFLGKIVAKIFQLQKIEESHHESF